MVKYGKEYPEKETKRINRYVHYRNKQNEKKYEQALEKGYSGEEFFEKIVPEDVFPKYDYLLEKGTSACGNMNTGFADDDWGEPIDFTIEEMLDMPVMGDEIGKQNNVSDNESHDNSNHGMFCVTG